MAHCQTGQAPRAEHPELAEILDRHASGLSRLSNDQARVVSALIACRTAALGGHLRRCDSCGHESPLYNSCRNRHCPKCQSLDQTLSGPELARRFLSHVVPRRFVRVRHYGVLANAVKSSCLARARGLLGSPAPPEPAGKAPRESWQQTYSRIVGNDPPRCPVRYRSAGRRRGDPALSSARQDRARFQITVTATRTNSLGHHRACCLTPLVRPLGAPSTGQTASRPFPVRAMGAGSVPRGNSQHCRVLNWLPSPYPRLTPAVQSP